MKRRDFLQLGAMASVYPITASAARLSLADRVVETEPQPITLNANRVIGPLPHVWEEGIGSDRAVEGLRSQWQSDLRLVHAETGIKAVRFHGVFNERWASALALQTEQIFFTSTWFTTASWLSA